MGRRGRSWGEEDEEEEEWEMGKEEEEEKTRKMGRMKRGWLKRKQEKTGGERGTGKLPLHV